MAVPCLPGAPAFEEGVLPTSHAHRAQYPKDKTCLCGAVTCKKADEMPETAPFPQRVGKYRGTPEHAPFTGGGHSWRDLPAALPTLTAR